MGIWGAVFCFESVAKQFKKKAFSQSSPSSTNLTIHIICVHILLRHSKGFSTTADIVYTFTHLNFSCRDFSQVYKSSTGFECISDHHFSNSKMIYPYLIHFHFEILRDKGICLSVSNLKCKFYVGFFKTAAVKIR